MSRRRVRERLYLAKQAGILRWAHSFEDRGAPFGCAGGTGGHTVQLAIIAALCTIAVAGVIVAVQTYGLGWTHQDGDPWNYLAAGERLNAGHRLYALTPGDRSVFLRPPYWSVPLLAPPPIAVAWRVLALLGELAMPIWGLGCLAAVLASVGYLIGHRRFLAVALLALPLTLTAISGNFSALLLLFLIGTWLRRDHPAAAGTLVAVAVAVKLTPAFLIAWLVLTRRWRAAAWAVSVILAIVAISLMGAGPAAFAEWARTVPSSTPSPLALSTWTRLPPLAVAALLGLPVGVSLRSETWGFRFAAIASALATPALYFQAIAVLGAAFVKTGEPADRGRKP